MVANKRKPSAADRHEIVWHSAGGRTNFAKPGLSVDRQGRVCLNRAMLHELNAVAPDNSVIPFKAYLGYDVNTQRILLAPNDTQVAKEGTRPHSFGRRGTAHARGFLQRFGVDYSTAQRYIWVDRHNGAYVFEREDKYVGEGAN